MLSITRLRSVKPLPLISRIRSKTSTAAFITTRHVATAEAQEAKSPSPPIASSEERKLYAGPPKDRRRPFKNPDHLNTTSRSDSRASKPGLDRPKTRSRPDFRTGDRESSKPTFRPDFRTGKDDYSKTRPRPNFRTDKETAGHSSTSFQVESRPRRYETTNRHEGELRTKDRFPRSTTYKTAQPTTDGVYKGKPVSNGNIPESQPHRGPQKESLIVRKEMKYLEDKAQLSQRVESLLAKDDYTLALQLTEAAMRRDIETIVAWNQIIKYLFEQKKVAAAMGMYNDVKKRGAKPTVYTYSIIFNGLNQNSTVPSALRTALKLWESIKADNTIPAVYNPLLSVCKRRSDFTSMQTIFESLPADGEGRPDCSTYSLMLSVLMLRARTASSEDRVQISLQARRLWAVIVAQWQSGLLQPDDALASTMIEVLFCCARREDFDDVFSLVEQVYGIPRRTPRLNLEEKEDGSLFTNEMLLALNSEHKFKPTETHHRMNIGDVFEPTLEHLLLPSSRVLSALVKVSTSLNMPKVADSYFKTLTGAPYDLKPSQTGWKHYLSHLHYARSGHRAVKAVMEEIPAAGVEPTMYMYRRAVTACARNWRGPGTFVAATRVIEHVMDSEVPDDEMFELLEMCENWIFMGRRQGEAVEEEALKKMLEISPRLRNLVLMKGGSEASDWLDMCSKTVGMLDKVLNGESIIHWKIRDAMQTERLKMSTFVTRLELAHRNSEDRARKEGRQTEKGAPLQLKTKAKQAQRQRNKLDTAPTSDLDLDYEAEASTNAPLEDEGVDEELDQKTNSS